uniref:Uncharacterized protein n=1 Tax=Ditylenchus dipsaci TaxID=166011 RepID=A0A915ERK5_9BILA
MKARSAAIIHPDLVDKNPVPNYLSRVYSVPEFKPKTVPEFTARRRPIYKPNWPYFFSSHDDKWKFRFYRYCMMTAGTTDLTNTSLLNATAAFSLEPITANTGMIRHTDRIPGHITLSILIFSLHLEETSKLQDSICIL